MNNKFSLGDRVRIIRVKSKCFGEHGTICRVPSEDNRAFIYGVRLDYPRGNTSCDGACEPDHGWNILEEYLDFECGTVISEDDFAEVLMV